MPKRRGPPKGSLIHVCLCSDDRDLRPTAVAIRSAAVSAAEPERLVFHFVTTPEFADTARQLFREHVPGVRIEVHHNAKLDAQLSGLISWRKSSKSRRVLASPFNFAPFYLDLYINEESRGGKRFNTQRLIYLDTDTLILGDLAELHDMDLKGHSCAAVPYCLQRMEDYVNFEVLSELGFDNVYDPKACIANRGLLIIDVPTWKHKNITGKIEDWMIRYRNAERDLWLGGMSQPPWLLAMNGDYMELGEEWNCNSLGRDTMSMWESVTLRKNGYDHKALRGLGVKFGPYGSISPYVVTCSGSAKLLHYNGEMKPWVADRLRRQSPACALPRSVDHQWTWKKTVHVYCDDITFVGCAELWSLFITQRAAGALKDLESEWVEEERRWLDQKREDREKAEKERKDREKKAKEEQEKKEAESKKEEKEKDKDKKDKKKDKKKEPEKVDAQADPKVDAGSNSQGAPPEAEIKEVLEEPPKGVAAPPPKEEAKAPQSEAQQKPEEKKKAKPKDKDKGKEKDKKQKAKKTKEKDGKKEKEKKDQEEKERRQREKEEKERREREEQKSLQESEGEATDEVDGEEDTGGDGGEAAGSDE